MYPVTGFPKEILRNAASKGDVSWLLQRVNYDEKNTLDDLKSDVRQNSTDIFNNQWFYGLFDKLRNIGGESMSVQQLSVLALIAKVGNNGCSTADICDSLDTRLSSIQRQLGRLGKGYSFRTGGARGGQGIKGESRERDGLFLITEFEDPNNRKAKRWVLLKRVSNFLNNLTV